MADVEESEEREGADEDCLPTDEFRAWTPECGA